MFGNHAHCEVCVGVNTVLTSSQRRYLRYDGCEKIGLIDVVLALEDYRGPLQAHAGIDAGGRQGRAVALRVLVELHEHQVPQLDETFAVAIGVAPRHNAWGYAVAFFAQLGGQHIDFNHSPAVAALLLTGIKVYF